MRMTKTCCAGEREGKEEIFHESARSDDQHRPTRLAVTRLFGVLALLCSAMVARPAAAATVADVCATPGNSCAAGVANINVTTTITPTAGPVVCEAVLDFRAAGFPIVNVNAGGILQLSDVDDCRLTLDVGDLNVRSGGKISVNRSITRSPGAVSVNASGDIEVQVGGSITAIGGAGAPNPTIELFAVGDIDIAGRLEARGLQAVGFGGHIIIESEAGKVTIAGSALVKASATDPGGTLVIVKACEGIDLFGKIDATTKKRAAEVQLFSREMIRIIGGNVIADARIGELQPGDVHKITIEARDDIIMESALISAKSGASNKVGGTIALLSTEGKLSCDAASLIGADARLGGSDGGTVTLQSFEDLVHECTVHARGNALNGVGGTILFQSFDRDIKGKGSATATGKTPGAIVLKAAANPISSTGTFTPAAIRQPGMPEAAPKTIAPCAPVGGTPRIDLEKFVNGDDADVCPGVSVPVNSPLTYTFVVTNTGDVGLQNINVTDDILGLIGTIPSLAPGASQTLTKLSLAPPAGSLQNTAIATGTPVGGGAPVSDTDPACVTVPGPAVALEKLVNNDPADICPGLPVAGGSTLIYEYRVTNTGNTVLINLAVSDNLLGAIGTIPRLDPGQTSSLFRTTPAPASGQRENIGSVVGTPADAGGVALPGIPPVTAQDRACVNIPTPAVAIEKLVNNDPADTCPGLPVAGGSTLIYEYRVTNTGNTVLISAQVTDNLLGTIGTISRLDPGQTLSLFRTTTAPASGQRENIGSVVGTPASSAGVALPGFPPVSAQDPACVNVPTPAIDLEKFVNGQDADTCPGVTVVAGSTLTYEYRITNTGNTVLINVLLTDNLLGTIGTVPRLDPGQATSLFASAPAPASGQQRFNIGSVKGTPANAGGVALGLPDVTDTDPACANVPPAPPVCGDGILNQPSETCEPPGVPAGANGNQCRANCTVCGDGRIDAGEQCDDANQSNTDACRNDCVSNQPPDVAITKVDTPDPVNAGGTLTYDIDVTNVGGSIATNVIVTDPLPAGTTFVSCLASQGSCNQNAGVVTANLGSLAPGASAMITLVVTAPPLGQCATITNIAQVTATGDTNPANNTATATTSCGQLVCPTGGTNTTTPGGTLFVSVDANGDVTVRFDQSRENANDNSYGVNAIGWPGDHKFSNLTGSDQAEFQFKNASGNVVLRFKLDYLSAKSGTPSGFDTLGVSGGDGGLVSGSASHILSFDTSLAQNLNDTGYCSGGVCSCGGVNLLVNSPVADANYNIQNPACSQWNFTNSYFMKISHLAFGALGFGSVTVIDLHNSPAKKKLDGPFAPCPPGGGGGGDFCVGGVKPAALTMKYTGESCAATSHSQDAGKVTCTGDPANASPVRIVASDKLNLSDNKTKIWFDGSVSLNGAFEIRAANDGAAELKADTFVQIFSSTGQLLQTIKFHTSCSQPLIDGDQFGSLELTDFTPN